LPNGNTLICSGVQKRILEVTRDGKIVWDYRSPYGGEMRGPGGPGFGARPPGPPPLARDGGGGPPPLGPGPGGPGPGGPGGPGIFRATRIASDHPGLKGRALDPIPDPAPEKKPE